MATPIYMTGYFADGALGTTAGKLCLEALWMDRCVCILEAYFCRLVFFIIVYVHGSKSSTIKTQLTLKK